MNKINISIIEFPSLYSILSEVSIYIPYKVIEYQNLNDFLKTGKIDLENSLLIIKESNNKIINDINFRGKVILKLPEVPITISTLFEKINVLLIKKSYGLHSKIEIRDYVININTRTISKNNINLKLTEREVDIILFLNKKNKPQKIDVLENQVWNFSKGLETHTVETHVYRLRKKIKDKFNDDKFLISHEDGYLI